MTNKFSIYAHPDLNTAVSGICSNGQKSPTLIGEEVPTLELGALMILSWVARKQFTGAGKSSFSANTETFICNIWEFKAPSGERWYIAASAALEHPISQEVNGLKPNQRIAPDGVNIETNHGGGVYSQTLVHVPLEDDES